MQKVQAFLATLAIVALLLSGCRRIVDEDKEISVYATCYPIYALTDAVMANVPDARLHCLIQPQDGCLRAYALSDWDAYMLASADAVIAGGRGLESFESLLFSWGDSGPAVSALLYNLELYNQGTSHTQDEGESHLSGANPHLYMSIEGAKQIVEASAAVMMTLDPDYSEIYAENVDKALETLDGLFEETRRMLSPYEGQPVILMNEALIYPAIDYGFEIADWIDRESGDAFYDDALEDCLERISDCGARVVLIERQAPASLIQALRDAGFSVALIDVMSTHREGEGFSTYIEAQHDNAGAIRDAFIEAQSLEAMD